MTTRVRYRRLFLPVSLAILLTAAFTVPLPVFAERPGDSLALVDQVEVGHDDADGGEIDGDYLVMLVNVRRATVAYLVWGLLDADIELVWVPELTGGIDDSAYFQQQRDVFASTAEVAAALGLQAAGYAIEFDEPRGALVSGVLPGAPADGALRAGDIVTAVSGAQVRSAQELTATVRRSAGSTTQLEIVFERAAEQRRVTITPGPVPGLDAPGLGVQVEDVLPSIDLPVPVEMDTGSIGGPSAGLLIALTVYDKVTPVELAAGRQIAGTGGVNVDGTVTPIGGIALKVMAADRDGADVFLVPASQLDEARAALPPGSDLQIVGAATVEEAIEALGQRAALLAAAA